MRRIGDMIDTHRVQTYGGNSSFRLNVPTILRGKRENEFNN